MVGESGFGRSSEIEAWEYVQSELLIGTYSSAISEPAEGDTVTFSADSGMEGLDLEVGANVYVVSSSNSSFRFRGKLVSYDSSDGSGSIYVEKIPSPSWGSSPADWLIWQQDGPQYNLNVGFSFDDYAVPSAGATVAFTIDQPLLPVERNAQLLVYDVNNFANRYRCRVTSYDSGTGAVEGVANWAYNAGASVTTWVVVVYPAPPSGAGTVPTTITQNATAQAVDVGTLALPAGILAGDLIVITERIEYYFLAPSVGAETRFSNATEQSDLISGTNIKTRVRYRIADGTEAGTTYYGYVDNEGSGQNIQCVTFRGDVAFSQCAVGSIQHEGTSGNPSGITVASSAGSAPLVVIGTFYSSAAVSPRTMTKDSELASADTRFYTAWKIYNSSPANISIDMDDEGSFNVIVGLYFSLYVPGSDPGDAVVFEDDGGGGPAYPQADGSAIDISGSTSLASNTTITTIQSALPKAFYSAVITPTLLTGNISSVDTTNEIITWSSDLAAQGVVTGDTVIPAVGGTWPGGATTRGALYINMASATTFSLHLTLADALAGTSKINLTSSGSGTRTMHKLVHSSVGPNYGMSSVSPFGGSGTYETRFGGAFNFSPALPDAYRIVMATFDGVVYDSTPTAYGNSLSPMPLPGSKTTTTAVFRGGQNDIPVTGTPIDSVSGGVIGKGLMQPTTWAGQSTTAFYVSVLVF